MTPIEVSRVLAKAAAFDRRTVGEVEVLAWLEAIGDLDVGDALAAVTAHYRDSHDWLTPSHIRTLVTVADRERHREIREAREREAEQRAAITRGPVTDRSADVTALVRSVAERFAVTDPIHTKALARARRERGRPERERPLRKRRGKPTDWPPPTSDEVAALATRYLIDGHNPDTVADRLAVSRRWCRKTARRFHNGQPLEESA